MLSSPGKTRFTILSQVRPDSPNFPYAGEELANLTLSRADLLEGLLEAGEEGVGGSALEPAAGSRAKELEEGGERAEATVLFSARGAQALKLRDGGKGAEASALIPAKASLATCHGVGEWDKIGGADETWPEMSYCGSGLEGGV